MRQIMFPGDASFWFETLRSFNNIEYGGAGFGEDVARSGNVTDGDYDSWHDAYLAASDRSRRRRTTRYARANAGTGQGPTFMGLLATVSTAAPDPQRSDVVSLFFAAAWLGLALPALGVGFAAPAFGLLTPVKIFTAAIAALAVAAVGGLLATTGIHEAGWRT